jgi:hypothetical protein
LNLSNKQLRILRELEKVEALPDGAKVIFEKVNGALKATTTYEWNPESPKKGMLELREIETAKDNQEPK